MIIVTITLQLYPLSNETNKAANNPYRQKNSLVQT